MDQNYFTVESPEAPLRSPLTPTFEEIPSSRYPMSSSWAGAGSQLSDQDYFGSSDQYHDASNNGYLQFTNGGEHSYQPGRSAASGTTSFFSDAYEQTNPQAYWPNTTNATSDGLPSTSSMPSRSSMQNYGGGQTMNTRHNGGFVSPSLLNANTDPDSHWPGGQEKTERVDFGSYDPDAELFNIDEATTYKNTNPTDRGGSQPSRKPSKDQRTKGSQSSNGYANGSSSRSKGRAGSTTSVSGAGETLVQLRTASRKAKRTSASYKPATSPEEERARSSHNQVEKQYRNRLNHQFERLLAVLPTPGDEDEGMDGDDGARNSDRRLSKVEVLDMARQHIQMLEKEASELEQERQELVVSIGRMTDNVRGGGNGYGPDTAGNQCN